MVLAETAGFTNGLVMGCEEWQEPSMLLIEMGKYGG